MFVALFKVQVARDPKKMKENGYVGAQIRLRADAVPDIPLHLEAQKENAAISLRCAPRNTFQLTGLSLLVHLWNFRAAYAFCTCLHCSTNATLAPLGNKNKLCKIYLIMDGEQ